MKHEWILADGEFLSLNQRTSSQISAWCIAVDYHFSKKFTIAFRSAGKNQYFSFELPEAELHAH